VLASAVAMDKEVAKRLARDAGLPIVPYVSLKHERWRKQKQQWAEQIQKELGYPSSSNRRISDRALACIKSRKPLD